jgi:TIR domain
LPRRTLEWRSNCCKYRTADLRRLFAPASSTAYLMEHSIATNREAVCMAKASAFHPLIFISHSARRDREAYTNLTVVKKYLEKNGFDVLIDETRIDGGEEWRSCINTWLAHCQGAIILLTEKALNSAWVQKEAAILSWRKSRSTAQEFKLLPVLLGISAEDVKNSRKFGVLELVDYQDLMNLKGLALAKQLATLLESLRQLQLTTPRQLAEAKLASQLQAVAGQPALLNTVIARLKEDAGKWEPNKDLAGRTARLLLQAPLSRVVGSNALEPLKQALTREAMQIVVGMLRASWIDLLTAAMFVQVMARPEGTRAAALNGSELNFTELSLFARANGGIDDWKIIQISDRTGEDQSGSFVSQAAAELKSFALARDRDEMLRKLKRYSETRPILIVLPPIDDRMPLPDEGEINRLLQEYRSCTYFILSGAKPLAAGSLANFVRLDPQLGSTDERDAREDYDVLRMQMQVERQGDELRQAKV